MYNKCINTFAVFIFCENSDTSFYVRIMKIFFQVFHTFGTSMIAVALQVCPPIHSRNDTLSVCEFHIFSYLVRRSCKELFTYIWD